MSLITTQDQYGTVEVSSQTKDESANNNLPQANVREDKGLIDFNLTYLMKCYKVISIVIWF